VAGECVVTCQDGFGMADGACVRGTVCEGERCLEGQVCGATGCEFACEGIRVPGDYATLMDAVTALEDMEATICLAPGDYGDQILATNESLSVIGAGPDLVHFASVGGSGNVTIRGFSAESLGAGGGRPTVARYEGCRVTREVSFSVGTSIGDPSLAVTIRGCDIGGPEFYGVSLFVPSGAFEGAHLRMEDTWIHGGLAHGIRFTAQAEMGSLSVVNCTLTDNASGIEAARTELGTASVEIRNTLIAGSETALWLNDVDAVTANIALWDNVTNYGADATPPANLVTTDPMLDDGTPPTPRVGSPLIGAGDAGRGSEVDYYGIERAGRNDIGAVQAL
jgi:hypothetical protein